MKNLSPVLRHLQRRHTLGVSANRIHPNLITAYSVANCSWCGEAAISLGHLLEKKMKNSLSVCHLYGQFYAEREHFSRKDI